MTSAKNQAGASSNEDAPALHLASVSFGKDSLATILLALRHKEPLDEAVYCEVMFDENISGEVPEHRDFIYEIALPRLAQWGIKTTILRSEVTYVSSFKRVLRRGRHVGKINGFPLCGRCCIQRDCKLAPIRAFRKTLPSNLVQYLGIACDEPKRLLRLTSAQVSLLEKYEVTESMAFELCRKEGLLSPIYEFTNRGGCFFCPNAKKAELRHLYDHHQNLWARMLELQTLPNKVTEYFNRDMSFAEIDAIFRFDDAQASMF